LSGAFLWKSIYKNKVTFFSLTFKFSINIFRNRKFERGLIMNQVMVTLNNLAKIFKEELELGLNERNRYYDIQFGTEYKAVEARITFVNEVILVTFVDISDDVEGQPQITFAFPVEDYKRFVPTPIYQSGDVDDLVQALHNDLTETDIKTMIANDPKADALLLNKRDFPEAKEPLTHEKYVDGLLIILLDYITLHKLFKDDKYCRRKELIISFLKKATQI